MWYRLETGWLLTTLITDNQLWPALLQVSFLEVLGVNSHLYIHIKWKGMKDSVNGTYDTSRTADETTHCIEETSQLAS